MKGMVKRMQNLQMELKGGGYLELAFAAVKPGHEDQLFGEYFPKVGPVVLDYGARPLGSFKLTSPPSTLKDATFGAMFFWPSVESYDTFHEDPRFKALKGIRDDALLLLSNGHFFRITDDTSLAIPAEKPLEIRIEFEADTPQANTFLSLPCADNSPDKTHLGKTLSLASMNTDAGDTRENTATQTTTISFNLPANA